MAPALASKTSALDVMLSSSRWLTPDEVAAAFGNVWISYEERDIDPPPPVDGRFALRAMHARRTLDPFAAVRLLREAALRDRRALIALLLSPSLDLRSEPARRFATRVFEEVAVSELTPASLVRAVEAAARCGREDLVARSKKTAPETYDRAAPVIELVAARLERRGEVEAAMRLRDAG